MSRSTGKPAVLWRLLDGKPGHENQTAGLADALADRLPLERIDLPTLPRAQAWRDLLLGRCSLGRDLPVPDLLLGAGHATHPSLLACRRAYGGRAVVMMRPSLPIRWFDLCVIPEHDGVPAGPHVFVSRGALNRVRSAGAEQSARGLILVGGPSSHYQWRQDEFLQQVDEVLRTGQREWTIATSRRTPTATEAALCERVNERVLVRTPDETAPGWLAAEMAASATVWVSEDSVSMLYEALTAGAAVGLLAVPALREGRIKAGVDRLLDEGLLTRFVDWRLGTQLAPPTTPFNEAARCADWIIQQWFAS